jgi:MFS family permease
VREVDNGDGETLKLKGKDLLPDLPRDAWIVLAGDALSAIGTGLTLPFFVVYLHRVRGIDLGLAGLAVATVAVAGLLGNPTGGALTDRIGARKTVLVGIVPAAMGTAAICFVTQAPQAFAAAAVLGFGLAVIWPAMDSLLAMAVPPEARSSVFAVRHATLNAGLGLGALIAASVVDFSSASSFQLLYALDALSFLLFVPLLFALNELGRRYEPDPEAREQPSYRLVFADRLFLRFVALTALLSTVGYAQFNAAFPAYATGKGGISAAALGVAFAVNTLAVTILQLPVLRLMRGRRRTTGMALVFAIWGATWGGTLIAGGLGGGTAALAAFVSLALIFAVGETLMSPTVPPMVNDLASDRLRGRYNGLYTLSWTIGFIIGPSVAGVALGAGHDTAFFLSLVGACFVGALASLRLRGSLPAGVDIVSRAAPEALPTVAQGAIAG